MDLIWARYNKGQSSPYYLLLQVGITSGKLIALDADKVLDNDINLIRRNSSELKKMELGDKIEWLKTNIPMSYNRSLKTFQGDKLETLQVYSLKKRI